jgi:aspartyl-tRNA(Asn)/glutamyl-tRNA(Gln) amidotransferase subunit C
MGVVAFDPKNEFLSPDGAERIARLARLRLDSHEFATLAPQLETIVGHIERIAEIPESDLPEPELPSATTLRADRAEAGRGLDELAKNAARLAHGHVLVPRVIDAAR